MTRLVDLSMPVHRDMLTFPRVPPPTLVMYESWTGVRRADRRRRARGRLADSELPRDHERPRRHALRLRQAPARPGRARRRGDPARVLLLRRRQARLHRPAVRLPDHRPTTSTRELVRIGYTLKERDIVLIHTGAGAYNTEERYRTDHCGMTAEATRHLIAQGVRMMGIDAITFDPPVWAMFETKHFWEAHRVMIDEDYWHLENLMNLEQLPSHGFKLSVFPVKWMGTTAAPVRAVAIIEESDGQPRLVRRRGLRATSSVAGGQGREPRGDDRRRPARAARLRRSAAASSSASVDAERLRELARGAGPRGGAGARPARPSRRARRSRTPTRALGGGRSRCARRRCAEDSEAASFAGQQETYLHVEGADDVCARVVDCWASFFSERALFYRCAQGVARRPGDGGGRAADGRADKAGVLFTVDPVQRRRDRMIVEAVFGIGEQVVSGEVTPGPLRRRPDRARRSASARRTAGCSTRAELRIAGRARAGVSRSTSAGRRTSSGRSRAVSVYLLQSRPVTTL